jgi:uncharacterized membrane protein
MRDDLVSKEEDERLLKLDKAVEVYKQQIDDLQNKSAHFSRSVSSHGNEKISITQTAKSVFIILMYITVAVSAFVVAMLIISSPG